MSTAANELGVVYAKSEAGMFVNCNFLFFFSFFFFSNHLLNTWRTGNPLLPVSYQEMEDEVTRKKEKRKVAKPEGI